MSSFAISPCETFRQIPDELLSKAWVANESMVGWGREESQESSKEIHYHLVIHLIPQSLRFVHPR